MSWLVCLVKFYYEKYIIFCFCRPSSSTIKTHQWSDQAFRRSLQQGQKVSCKIHRRGHWLQQGHCPLLQRSRWGSPSCPLGFPKYHWCQFSPWLEHQRPRSPFRFEKEAWFHQSRFYRLDFLRTFHRGAFCKFPFQWIYYYGSNKSTGKETGKMHICGMGWDGCGLLVHPPINP